MNGSNGTNTTEADRELLRMTNRIGELWEGLVSYILGSIWIPLTHLLRGISGMLPLVVDTQCDTLTCYAGLWALRAATSLGRLMEPDDAAHILVPALARIEGDDHGADVRAARVVLPEGPS